jgi:ethanolamine utilization protein EutN
MFLAKVVGTATSSRKHKLLTGTKLQVVEPIEDVEGTRGRLVIAVDTVGAGVGELVLVAVGSMARFALMHPQSPIDATIVGIVDRLEVPQDNLKELI